MMYRFKLWILAALVPSASCAKLDSEAGVPVKSNSVLQTQQKVAIWMQAAVDRYLYIIYQARSCIRYIPLNMSWDYLYQLKLDIPSSLNTHTLYCNHFTKFHVLRDSVGNSRCIVVHKSCYVANSGEEKKLVPRRPDNATRVKSFVKATTTIFFLGTIAALHVVKDVQFHVRAASMFALHLRCAKTAQQYNTAQHSLAQLILGFCIFQQMRTLSPKPGSKKSSGRFKRRLKPIKQAPLRRNVVCGHNCDSAIVHKDLV